MARASMFEGDLDGLPPFQSGRLPSGFYSSSLSGLRESTCFNEERTKMFGQLMAFMTIPILTHKFSHAYIGGDFISSEPGPAWIDVALQTSQGFGPEAISAAARYFSIGLDRMEIVFGIRLVFWIEGLPDFFAIPGMIGAGSVQATKHGPVFSREHGVARLNLHRGDILVSLQQQLRND
jgi:hypothetical protein